MRLVPDPTAAPREVPEHARPAQYVTDGHRLFRIVSMFEPGSPPFAQLEDCLTLEVQRYSADDLFGMGLRPVRTG